MRAGTYVLGDSSGGCPSGSTRIADSATCQSAAAANGASTSPFTADTTPDGACTASMNYPAAAPAALTISGVNFISAATADAAGFFSYRSRRMCILGPSPSHGLTLTTSAQGLIRSRRGTV